MEVIVIPHKDGETNVCDSLNKSSLCEFCWPRYLRFFYELLRLRFYSNKMYSSIYLILRAGLTKPAVTLKLTFASYIWKQTWIWIELIITIIVKIRSVVRGKSSFLGSPTHRSTGHARSCQHTFMHRWQRLWSRVPPAHQARSLITHASARPAHVWETLPRSRQTHF